MSTEDNKELVRRWGRVWQAGNLGLVDELASPDLVVFYPLFSAELHGREAFKQLVTRTLASFPDVQLEFQELLAEGDKVVGRWRAWGTSLGEFAGYPPTGARVEWTGISIYRIAGDKIVEDRGEEDINGMLRQLGSSPAPDAGG